MGGFPQDRGHKKNDYGIILVVCCARHDDILSRNNPSSVLRCSGNAH